MKRGRGAGRHDIAGISAPIAGYGALPTSPNNTRHQILPVAIVDAYDPQHRVRALARVDLLDKERRAGAIDEASYLIGREIERVFEHMNAMGGGGQWFQNSQTDAATSAEMRSILGFERALVANAFLRWLTKHVGRQDTRLLYIMLGCRFSFSTAASYFNRPGLRGYRNTVDRFREALSVLAMAKAAKGVALR